MNKEKNSIIYRIFNFPNKINVITMFVVVVVYGLVLLLLAKVITPEADYVVELNYPPATYNSEINPYIFVRGTAINASEDENKIDLRMQYRIIAYINKMNTKR